MQLLDTNVWSSLSKKEKKTRKILIGFASVIPTLIFFASLIWPTDSTAGESVKSRPPGWVFGFMWTFIVIAVIVAWILVTMYTEDMGIVIGTFATFTIFIALAVTWQGVYHTIGVKEGSWVLWSTVLSLIWTLMFSFQSNWVSGLLMTVPLTWASFAAVLNTLEAQYV
jgi:tryptophan-rich sensory protein